MAGRRTMAGASGAVRRGADTEASQAVQAAAVGAWREALAHAQAARVCEYLTGRTVWRGNPTTWQPLLRAVFAALPDHPAPEAVEELAAIG